MRAGSAGGSSASCPPSLSNSRFDDFYRFASGGVVGRGKYSVVKRAVRRDTDDDSYVVKIISRNAEGHNPEESELLRLADHPNIVRLVDSFQTEEASLLVMPHISGGEAFQLASTPTAPMSEQDAAGILFQLLDALSYLHAGGVVHRDVKLENIMVAEDKASCHTGIASDAVNSAAYDSLSSTPPEPLHSRPPSSASSGASAVGSFVTTRFRYPIKLIDFGFSKRIGTGERTLTSCCGSPHYMSPEMLRASRPAVASLPSKHGFYGTEVDIWAAGVALFVLLFGEYPFHDEKHSRWHRQILEGKYSIPQWRRGEVSSEALDLLSRLLDVSVSTRITAIDALAHPWFASFGLRPTKDAAVTHIRPLAPQKTSPRGSKTPPGQATSSLPATATGSAPMPMLNEEGLASADGGDEAAASNMVAFTPPRNTHRLTQESPYS